MTERKPPGVAFESWVDRQIREAAERGAFQDLPGAGRPLPGKGQPYDEDWWIKAKLEREQISFLPPSLQLMRDLEQLVEEVLNAAGEDRARALLEEANRRIRHAQRFTPGGPPVRLRAIDVAEMLRRRTDARPPAAED